MPLPPPPPPLAPARPTPVVWAPAPPAPAQRAAEMERVTRWAEARGLRLVAPKDDDDAGVTVDLGVGDDVERALDGAHDALAALDAERAEHDLAEAEATLRAHPELPHAAWLRAEVDRAWAERFARVEPKDPERAARAWAAAEGLDGGRLAGIGEAAGLGPRRVQATIELDGGEGDADGVVLRVDGASVRPGSMSLAPGEHQVVLSRDGVVRWADWVGVAEGTHVRVPLAPRDPCSARALAHVAPSPLGDGGPRGDREDGAPRDVDARGVACPAWAVVVTAPGALLAARCTGARCEPFVHLEPREIVPIHRGGPEHGSAWPAWATWTIVGAAVVAATGLTLYGAGAFDGPSHETRFQNGGLKTSGFDF